MIKFDDLEKEKVTAAFKMAEKLFITGRLTYTNDEDGDGYPIIDALTPPGGTTNVGENEVRMLLDTYLPEILEAFVNA